jgi:maleylacetoacetate isomerase
MNWKGLKYEYKPIHLLKDGGQQKSTEFLKLNPQGHVPFLIHDGFGIGESVAIIDYLDHVFPEKKLFPTNPRERAEVLRLCEHINSGIQPLQNAKVQAWLGERVKQDPKVKEEFTQHWIKSGLHALEKMLLATAGTYSFGGNITAADCFVVPQVFSSKRFGVDVDLYPTVLRVYENCEKLLPFQNAHPSKQPDAE